MKLLFVRHGQSTNNAGTSAGGHHPDSPLTALGHRQARSVARHLTRTYAGQVVAVYSSPFRRALQTAAPIAAALGLPVQVAVPLHEMWGQYAYEPDGSVKQHPGLSRAEMLQLVPEARLGDDVTDEGWWFGSWPGVDNAMLGMGDNAGRFLDLVANAHQTATAPADIVCAVGHGGSGDALVKRMAQGAHTFASWFELDNTSLSQMHWYQTPPEGERRVVIDYLNRVHHLPRRLRTPNYRDKL